MSLWNCSEHGLYGGDVFCPKCDKSGEIVTVDMSGQREEWRPVHLPEMAPFYEVSNFGRVRSKHHGGRIKAPRPNSDGYPMVVMFDGQGGKKGMAVHRLVCWAFHGAPNILHNEAAHLDGSRTNSRADNLRWVSRVENMAHKRAHGTLLRGEKHSLAKLTESQVVEILDALAVGDTTKRIAARYGVTSSAIEDIRTGKNWRHVPRPPKLIERLTTGNGQNGANNHNAGLGWAEVDEIRSRAAKGEHIPSLGKEFGISRAAVYKLVKGDTYRRSLADMTIPEIGAMPSNVGKAS